MQLLRKLFMIFLFMAVYGQLTSCATSKPRHYSSNVVQYLYPNKRQPVEIPEIPLLSLPLKVGIAFVPETMSNHKTLTELNKTDLMKEVSTHFKKYDFVKSIEIIPSPYLTQNGSFANLDQIRTMFGIDVIALLSYDQTPLGLILCRVKRMTPIRWLMPQFMTSKAVKCYLGHQARVILRVWQPLLICQNRYAKTV